MMVELPAKGDVAIACKAINLAPDLSNSERRVAGAIVDHFNRRNGRCDPSVQRLSKLLGMNRATVLRATAKLTSIGCGMFSKRSHGGYSNCASYQPNWKRFQVLVKEWDASMKYGGKLDVETPPSELGNVAVESSSKSQICSLVGRNVATQTNSKNQLEKPIVKGSGKIESRHSSHFHESKENQTQSRRLAKPKRKLIPEAKLRQPSHETAAIEAAKGRIDRDFYAMKNHIYVEFVENVSPELLEMAAKEEVNLKGRGMRLIHAELSIERGRGERPDSRLKMVL